MEKVERAMVGCGQVMSEADGRCPEQTESQRVK